MKLLDSLFEQGLYVGNLDSVLDAISQHPDVIDDLANIVPKFLRRFGNAIHLLYVGENGNLVYSVGFNSEDEYLEACSLCLSFKPKSKHFEIEFYCIEEIEIDE